MTFKTTSLPLIQAFRVRKDLREYIPVRPIPDQRRWLLVTPHIEDLLRGRTEFGVFPDREAEVLIGRYAAGHLLTVSRAMTEEKPDIEQIVDADEVWALCPRRPKPGWRILGRFYDKDIFIAFRAWDKTKLFGNYPKATAEVISDWEALFDKRLPHSGKEISDYLSGVIKDVDETL